MLLIDLPGLGASRSNPAAGIGHQQRWADVMSWLQAQAWCTGKVGMSGVSALCATQWIAAMGDAPPQLKAIIPWEGFNEQGPGGGYGGIPETAFPAWIGTVWVGPNINHDAPGPEPFLFDWKHDPSTIRVPALVCASFSDQELHSGDTFEAFRLLDTGDKWLFTHRRQKWGAYYGADELALQKRFLDKFLKDADDTLGDLPRVRLEINESRFAYTVTGVSQWPPAETRYRELYLDAQAGSLSPRPPATTSSATITPAPTSDTANRAVFDVVFPEDTDVVGNSALRLFIETEDSHRRRPVRRGGETGHRRQRGLLLQRSGGNANGPVTRGWLRASKRALNNERSTDARPVLSSRRRAAHPRRGRPGRHPLDAHGHALPRRRDPATDHPVMVRPRPMGRRRDPAMGRNPDRTDPPPDGPAVPAPGFCSPRSPPVNSPNRDTPHPAGAANGGLVLDVWRCRRNGSSLARLAAIPAHRLFTLQLSDGPTDQEPDLSRVASHGRCLPRTGQLDVDQRQVDRVSNIASCGPSTNRFPA